MANPPNFTCRVFNATPEVITNHAIWVELGGGSSTNAPPMPPGQWTVFNRAGTEALKLSKDGLQWEGVQGKELKVVDGGEYRIIVDNSCPPLSRQELATATDLLFDFVEVLSHSHPHRALYRHSLAHNWVGQPSCEVMLRVPSYAASCTHSAIFCMTSQCRSIA
jgi:hypothetical protein